MSCDLVSVYYPSSRLLPLVNEAINAQEIELKWLLITHEDKIKEYENLSWFQKIINQHPNSNHYTNDTWYTHTDNCRKVNEAISCLRKIRMVAEAADTVRLTGDCLGNIDKWCGN